jgi:hypothetical protein
MNNLKPLLMKTLRESKLKKQANRTRYRMVYDLEEIMNKQPSKNIIERTSDRNHSIHQHDRSIKNITILENEIDRMMRKKKVYPLSEKMIKKMKKNREKTWIIGSPLKKKTKAKRKKGALPLRKNRNVIELLKIEMKQENLRDETNSISTAMKVNKKSIDFAKSKNEVITTKKSIKEMELEPQSEFLLMQIKAVINENMGEEDLEEEEEEEEEIFFEYLKILVA